MRRVAELLSLPVLIHLLVLRPILKLIFGVHVEGRDNLTRLEQCILVANHNSHLDVLLLFHVLPARRIRYTHPVAAYEYFSRSRVLLWLADHLLQPVWIVRGDTAGDPLEGMRKRLAQGHSIVIFPEGTRGQAGKLTRFKTGVGRLAEGFPEVPIVPLFLSGPEKALPKTESLAIPLWNHVAVGPPQRFTGTAETFTRQLESMVRELGESDAGGRHRRLVRARRVPTLAVLGIDGSGKSTLSRALAQCLSPGARACLVTDDVEFFENGEKKDLQPLLAERLRKSIGRSAKTAGSLKSYKIPKLAELLLRDHIAAEIRKWYAPDVIVMDGSPLLNVAAWAKLYREDDFDESMCRSTLRVLSGRDEAVARDDPVFAVFPELAALKRFRLTHLAVPDVVLFLDVDPAVSLERIRSRGEQRQVHETEEKLGRLRDGYRMVCTVVERDLGTPARTLDGHRPLVEVAAAAIEELRRAHVTTMSHLHGMSEPNAAMEGGADA